MQVLLLNQLAIPDKDI